MEWPKGRQLAAYDKHCEAAYDWMLAYLARPEVRERIVRKGRQRMGGIGFDLYQDQSFRLRAEALLRGIDEELADTNVYASIGLTRGLKPWSTP